ncbi:MAG TPA: hypothetical protein VJV22_14760 [Acidobacteriaceae bacterium]|nr:hypothetical protein [Acidobacteriaceae bacterium]
MLHIAAGVCLGIVAAYLLFQISSTLAVLLWILVPAVWGALKEPTAAAKQEALERQAMYDEWERVWPGYRENMERQVLAFQQEHEAKRPLVLPGVSPAAERLSGLLLAICSALTAGFVAAVFLLAWNG